MLFTKNWQNSRLWRLRLKIKIKNFRCIYFTIDYLQWFQNLLLKIHV